MEHSDKEEYEINERIKIQDYITSNNLNYTEMESGLYYMVNRAGNGVAPEIGDFVIYKYTIYLLDSTLFLTTDSSMASEHEVYDTNLIYGPDKREVGTMIPGKNEALTYMKEGGAASLIIPFKLGYGDFYSDKIPARSTLLCDLELMEVIKEPFVHEQRLLENYISQNKDFKKLIDGLYYKVINEGNDTTITATSKIYFEYKLYLLDGRHVVTKSIEAYNGNIPISGLQAGMQSMSEHEKGVFLIRSDLAYKDDANLTIPPYTTLKVEVEINELE